MKIFMSALAFLALPSVGANFATVGIADYNGAMTGTLGENEFVLCGQDAVGCLGIKSSSSSYPHFLRSCKTNPELIFGELEGKAQTWQYDEALLRSGKDSRKCLAISTTCDGALDASLNYPLAIQDCSSANPMQLWILAEDSRVHSGANYELCLTIDDINEEINVTPCPSTLNEEDEIEVERDVPYGQSLQLVSSDSSTMPMEPFVHTLHTDYGIEDTVSLIFWTDEEIEEKNIVETLLHTVQTLEIFPAQTILDTLQGMGPQAIFGTLEKMTKDVPVYTSSTSSFSTVVTIPASELVPEYYMSSEPIRLVATMGSAQSQTFTIHPNTKSIIPLSGCDEGNLLGTEESPLLAVVLAALGALVVATAVVFLHRRLHSSKAATAAQSSTETKDLDANDNDAATDASESVVGE